MSKPSPLFSLSLGHLRPGGWLLLALAVIVTAILSQGVHDIAIEHLGIPYPYDNAAPAWAKCLHDIVRIGAMVVFCRAASASFDKRSVWFSIVLTGALMAALDEALRVVVIEWTIVDGWKGLNGIYVLTDRAPLILASFYRGAIAAVIARYFARKPDARAVAAVAITGLVGYFAVSPLLRAGAPAIWSALHQPDPTSLYMPPYDWHVLPFIYGMFVEPTIATVVMAVLIWPRLGDGPARRIGMFVLLLLFVRGRIVAQLLLSFWVRQPLPLAFLAEAQFFFETAVLALLCGLICERLYRNAQGPAGASPA